MTAINDEKKQPEMNAQAVNLDSDTVSLSYNDATFVFKRVNEARMALNMAVGRILSAAEGSEAAIELELIWERVESFQRQYEPTAMLMNNQSSKGG